MNDQLALVGAATPPELHLTEKQREALEHLHAMPRSSEALGAFLHSRRHKHVADRTCRWCAVEGAAMGRALRVKGLVRYAQQLRVWYCVEDGRPEAEPARPPEGAYDPASQEIPF